MPLSTIVQPVRKVVRVGAPASMIVILVLYFMAQPRRGLSKFDVTERDVCWPLYYRTTYTGR